MRVVLRREAERELIAAAQYYESCRPGQDAAFLWHKETTLGGADVVINLNDDCITVFENARDALGITTRGAIVHGPQTRSFVLSLTLNR